MDFIEDTGSKVVNYVTSIFQGEQKEGNGDCHRYGSFAKVRNNVHAKWYVDGKDYYYAVSEALSKAREEIFIEDWWLSPEVYLRRPPYKNEEYRLDRLLKKKAEEGVKIYVILYKEVTQALTLNSKHSKGVLNKLHPNIVVQRHPDHGIGGTFLWAKIVVIDRHVSFVGGLDLCFGRYDTHTHQLSDYHAASGECSIWPGQDYSNPRIKDFVDVNVWAQTLIDKKQLARMPWHDIHIGKPALDEARHFIERWNFVKKEKAQNKIQYPVLIAKSDRRHDFENPPAEKPYTYFGKTIKVHPEKGTCSVQICRSSSIWSHGIETEHSIQNAYIDIITNAKHFIYIENQFFITATKVSPDYPVKNLIGKAIVDRIIKAHKNNETFKIIVVMPLLPSFPAELDTSEAAVDPHGIVDVDETRTFVTEELYIHSKLLIADDRIVICGSANLNDRSQNGDHDSEIAAVIEDNPSNYIDSKMGGKPWKAGRFAATLRRAIFKEHLGLELESNHETCTEYSHPPPHHVELKCESHELTVSDKTVEDPASDKFYNDIWTKTADDNTEIFRDIFHCTPDDTVTNWDEFKAFTPDRKKVPLGHVCNVEKTPVEVEGHLKKIKGHLVTFPLKFMENTKLSGSVVFDAVTPMELFT
nr:7954_t:CDS:10 [Entrophospora candida]